MILLNSPFLIRAIWITEEEFRFSPNIHFDIVYSSELTTIVGQNDREYFVEGYLLLVQVVLDSVEVFSDLISCFVVK